MEPTGLSTRAGLALDEGTRWLCGVSARLVKCGAGIVGPELWRCQGAVVRVLLETAAATEAKDNYGKTLLLCEFGSGHEPR